MAFDELTKHQRRLLLDLMRLLNSGRYEKILTLRYSPATEFENGRWQFEFQGIENENGTTIDVYDESDLSTLYNGGYITAKYGDSVELTSKVNEQHKLLTEVPNKNTSPADLVKFWLEELSTIEEGLNERSVHKTEQRFFRWKERAVRSISEFFDSDEAHRLAEYELTPLASVGTVINRARSFLEMLLEDMRKYGDGRKTPETLVAPAKQLGDDPVAGSILDGRYELIKQLGGGGTSRVHLAMDRRLARSVAIKEITIEDADQRAALQREGSLLANLQHPSLPAIIDYFIEDKRPFIVMQYIPGDDLYQSLMKRNKPFRQDETVSWAKEILEVLDYLHSRSPPIIHRDIKPSNLKLTEQGRVILLDFGLSKGSAGQMPTLVNTPHSIHGFTRDYASLEQIHGTGTDERSDLFSLAVTLYHLMTAQTPASAPDRYEARERSGADPLRQAHELNPAISVETSEVLARALELNPRDRYQSAAEMLAALSPLFSPANESSPVNSENAPRVRQDPDLEFAMQVDRELSFKKKRNQWNSSERGVAAAQEAVDELFEELITSAEKHNKVLTNISLGAFQNTKNKLSVCGVGLCLFLEWNCPHDHNLKDSNLIVEVYKGKFDFTNGTAVPAEQNSSHKAEYEIDMDNSEGIGWFRKGAHRQFISTTELARSCLSTLLGAIRRTAEEL